MSTTRRSDMECVGTEEIEVRRCPVVRMTLGFRRGRGGDSGQGCPVEIYQLAGVWV